MVRRTQRRQLRSRASATSVVSRATSPAYARATSLGSKMASVRMAGKVLRNNSSSTSPIKLACPFACPVVHRIGYCAFTHGYGHALRARSVRGVRRSSFPVANVVANDALASAHGRRVSNAIRRFGAGKRRREQLVIHEPCWECTRCAPADAIQLGWRTSFGSAPLTGWGRVRGGCGCKQPHGLYIIS